MVHKLGVNFWKWKGFIEPLVIIVCLLSHVWLCNPIDYSPPLSMEFSRQEYWSGLPFPSLGDQYHVSYISEKPRTSSAAAAAAAAAKSLQSCLTLCDPIDGSPPGSPVPGILQARTQEWVAISFSNAWKWKVKVKSLDHVQLLATSWTAAYQAPLSMGFFQARVLEWGAIAISRTSSRGC